MKILFLSANRLSVPYPVYPIGLDFLSGVLEKKHTVEIIDTAWTSEQEIASAIQSLDPDLVGISIRNIDNSDLVETRDFLDDYRSLADLVRKSTRSPLVLGGSGFTIAPEALMESLDADYGIIGEGERLLPLADELESGGNVGDLNLPGMMVRGKPRPETPEPWHGPIVQNFRKERGIADHYLRRGGMLNLQTKRGCPYSCIYCTYPLIEGNTVRCFDPTKVGRTARKLQDAGAAFIFVTDAVFNSDSNHAVETARAIKKAGLTIPWGAYFAPVKTRDDFWSVMAECGLTHVEFGTESLSNAMLKTYRKPFDAVTALESHRRAVDAGLNVAHFFLLGGPGENEKTLDETFLNAEKLNKSGCFFFCGIRIYPGTELCSIAKKQGQISEDTNPLNPVFYSPPELQESRLLEIMEDRARGRSGWIAGSGGARMAKVLSKMYDLGHTGPLWEKLIR